MPARRDRRLRPSSPTRAEALTRPCPTPVHAAFRSSCAGPIARVISKHQGPHSCRFQQENSMIKLAIIFALISLIAGALGFTGVAAGAAGIAKILFVVFLVLFVAVLLFALLGATRISTKRTSPPSIS